LPWILGSTQFLRLWGLSHFLVRLFLIFLSQREVETTAN
jgi:hypothetical protein